MRAVLIQRGKDRLPTLWSTQPDRIHSWFKLDTPAWCSLPILSSTVEQCATIMEVDAQVHDYWVRQVWHMHAEVYAEELWQTFSASPFFPHIHTCRWQTSHWTSDRIGDILRRMTSSPGVRGLPISL